jgi:general secretion pathway protein L
LQQRAERVLQAAQSSWDLAQFDLAHANRDRRWAVVTQAANSLLRAPQWRPARFALVLGVLVNLIGLNAWALREHASLNAKRQAVRAVFLETFPKVPVVVDAPLQMAREVAALQRATGAAAGADLESMLASFSTVAPAGYALTSIEYVAQELRLKGSDMGDASAVVARLKAMGLRATRQGDQWLLSAGSQP